MWYDRDCDPGDETPTILASYSWGGTSNYHDWLMSDGSIRSLRNDEVPGLLPNREVYWKLREEPDWQPYCGACPTMKRMDRRMDGTYKCSSCGLHVGRDMKEIKRVYRRSPW